MKTIKENIILILIMSCLIGLFISSILTQYKIKEHIKDNTVHVDLPMYDSINNYLVRVTIDSLEMTYYVKAKDKYDADRIFCTEIGDSLLNTDYTNLSYRVMYFEFLNN